MQRIAALGQGQCSVHEHDGALMEKKRKDTPILIIPVYKKPIRNIKVVEYRLKNLTK